MISETNYTVDSQQKRNKVAIFHVNLFKPYHKTPEFVNLVTDVHVEEVEEDAEVPYPMLNPTQIKFCEIGEQRAGEKSDGKSNK